MTPAELKAKRAELGLSQAELGKAVGRSRRQVSNWESGATPVPRAVELALAGMKKGKRK